MKIGFFDSGVGGLTVLKRALKEIPGYDYLYYADTLHAPYGSKPKEEVLQHVFAAVDLLVQEGVTMIVMACNTATSIAAAPLREKYKIPIIGMEPAVKPAIEISQKMKKRVLVTATELTLKEEKFRKLLTQYDDHGIVDLCPMPGLVKLAEAFDFTDQSVLPYLEATLAAYVLEDYGTVVFGCTHFPLFTEQFKKVFAPDIVLIDGGVGTIKHLQMLLGESKASANSEGKLTFYCSGELVSDCEMIMMFQRILGINRFPK